jgi:hypothetical protein
VILHSYASEQIHKHTAEDKEYENVHEDNYLFNPQTSESREIHGGGFNYYIWYALLEVGEIEM